MYLGKPTTKGLLVQINIDGDYTVKTKKGDYITGNVLDKTLKIIVKSIEKINRKDVYKVADISGKGSYEKGMEVINELFVYDPCLGVWCQPIETYQYLLSQGYGMPYMEYSEWKLIDEGIYIHKRRFSKKK